MQLEGAKVRWVVLGEHTARGLGGGAGSSDETEAGEGVWLIKDLGLMGRFAQLKVSSVFAERLIVPPVELDSLLRTKL